MELVSGKELVAMGRRIDTPIALGLAADMSGDVSDAISTETADSGPGTVLVLKSILRLLPGKRLVALTQWQGKPAIAKVFYQPGNWRRHLQRERNGLEFLNSAGLNIPAQWHQSEIRDSQGAVLISEYLSQATSLEQLSRDDNNEDHYLRSVSRVVKIIGECHKQGIWQQDIHPDNFLLTADRIFCIDGASVNKNNKPGPLPESTCLQNIILFLAQFPTSKDKFLPELFTNYQQSRADAVFHIAWDQLRQEIIAARTSRLDNYQKKLFRSSSDHHCRHNATRFVIYKRSIEAPDLQRFINDPDSYLSTGAIIKAGNSSTVARVAIAGTNYVVKRYNIKNPWHGLKRLLRPSRAHNCWLYASQLQMLGIATAAPLLCLEQRWLWLLRGKAYFLCEELTADTVADQLKSPQAKLLTQILDAYQNLFVNMQRYRISHGDMKATNFLFSDGNLFVLDLDAMRRHKSVATFVTGFKKDLVRFRKNWLDNAAIDQRTQMLVNDILTTLN